MMNPLPQLSMPLRTAAPSGHTGPFGRGPYWTFFGEHKGKSTQQRKEQSSNLFPSFTISGTRGRSLRVPFELHVCTASHWLMCPFASTRPSSRSSLPPAICSMMPPCASRASPALPIVYRDKAEPHRRVRPAKPLRAMFQLSSYSRASISLPDSSSPGPGRGLCVKE